MHTNEPAEDLEHFNAVSSEDHKSTYNTSNIPLNSFSNRRSVTRSLRGPFFPGSPSRSISLPQALHSFTLSSSTPNRNLKSSQRAHNNVQSDSQDSTVGSNSGPQQHLMNTEIERDEYAPSYLSNSVAHPSMASSSSASSSAMISAPVSPTSKRAISEGHDSSLISKPRTFGRSETTTRLPDIMYGDTELLDPLPKLEFRSQKWNSQHGSSVNEDSVQMTKHNHRQMLNEPDSLTSDCENVLTKVSSTQIALSNMDILHHIFDALDAMTVVPHELVQQRRKPLSLRHAQLIFGDTKKAAEAWEKSQPSTAAHTPGAGLYNCLYVNSTWYNAAVHVLESRIHFRKNELWTRFARRGASNLSRKPRMLVLHKLNEATQVELDMLDSAELGENLEWLEFYTCAGLAPPASMLGAQLTRIILPGCYRVNDRTLAHIAEKCPNLEHLDVRACEQVSDRGIKMIAKFCPQLQLLNVGRTRGGENITYKGIKHLARQTQIITLGLAGCSIDDRAIWELALNRGPHLQRLSLNNCRLLTDASVPRVLGYMPNLTVLEIRGCIQITHMRPLALFKAYREKQGQPPLVEGCEVIERRMQVAILRLQREMSQRVLNDLLSWVNSPEEAEVS